MTNKNRESLLLPLLIPLGGLVVIGLVLYGFSRILLHVTAHAATAAALVTAAGIVGIAAYTASRRKVVGGSLLSMVVGIAGIAMLAGGAALLLGKPAGEAEAPFALAIVAPKNAASSGFAQSNVTAPSGRPIEIDFDNEDPNVQHNVVVFDGPDDSAAVLTQGALITGPAQTKYAVPALDPGSYFFHCEVHPTVMTGTIKIAAGEGGAGGGGTPQGITVVAQNTSFNTDTIELVAGKETPITFENQDPGLQHNIAIYSGDDFGTALFQGELVTGPETKTYTVPPLQPGTYPFHCDVHPQMLGKVIVAAPEDTPGGGGGNASGGPPSPGG